MAIFASFKALADKKKVITDADLEALVSDKLYQPRELYRLESLQVACGTMGMPTATIRLSDPQGKLHVNASVGTGPVDAAYRAVNAIVNLPNVLQEFVVHAITEGIDSLGEVTVRIQTIDEQTEPQAHTYGGYGADTDIIVASVKAYLSAINKVLVATGRFGPPEEVAMETISTEKMAAMSANDLKSKMAPDGSKDHNPFGDPHTIPTGWDTSAMVAF